MGPVFMVRFHINEFLLSLIIEDFCDDVLSYIMLI